VEQIRRLVESDEVLFLVNPVGPATNIAVLKYVNRKKVPHLFIGSGATIFNDPERLVRFDGERNVLFSDVLASE
jgi:hypothetical protein